MTFLELAQEVLEKAEQPLGYKEIWEAAKEKGLDKKLESLGKTPWQSLGAQLYVNTRDKADTLFMIVSRQPTQFWLKARAKELDNIKIDKPEIQQKRAFNERDLHPLFVKFLKEGEEFDAYAKTIYHEQSSKSQKGKDKWNFPDIIAVHFPFNDYDYNETLTLAKHTNQNEVEIYSFELKVLLDWSNLKESYFQAVSNSSFANEGYLVVFEIDDKDKKEILEEIKRLNQSFGIGLIQLELDKIEVILPSNQRELDFETIDMLIGKNPDFKKFIENVNKDFETNDKERIATKNYDEILSDEKLKAHIQNKKIVKN